MPNPLAEIQSAIQKAPSSDGPANTIDTIVSTNSKKLQVPLGIETEDIISEDIISETLVTNNITTEYGNSFFGKRQSIIAGKTSSKNYSNFLEFESHNSKNVIVKASPDDPLIVSISNGYNEYGIPSNIIKRYDSDIIFDLTGYENKRCFLGLEVDAQGNTNKIITTVPPVYSDVLTDDSENKVCITFNGVTSPTTVFTDYYGNRVICNENGDSSIYPGSLYPGNYSLFGGFSGTNTISFTGVVVELNNFNSTTLKEWSLEFDIKFETAGSETTVLEIPGLLRLRRLVSNMMDVSFGVNSNPFLFLDNVQFTNAGGGGGETFNALTSYKFCITFDGYILRILVEGRLVFIQSVLNYIVENNIFEKIYLFSNSSSTGTVCYAEMTNIQFWPYVKYLSVVRSLGSVIYTPSNSLAVPDLVNKNRYIQHKNIAYFDFENLSNGRIIDFYNKRLFGKIENGDGIVQAGRSSAQYKFGTRSLYRPAAFNINNHTCFDVEINEKEPWTFSFWYRTEGNGNDGHTIAEGNHYPSFRIRSTNIGQVICEISTDNGIGPWNVTLQLPGGSFGANYWYHFILTFTGRKYRLSVDGNIVESSSTVNNKMITSPSKIVLGPFLGVNTGNPYNSYYDDVLFVPWVETFSTPYVLPVTPYQAPSFYYYDKSKAKMYLYSGVDFSLVPKNVIFIGEVSLGNVQAMLDKQVERKIVSYAINEKTEIANVVGPDEGGLFYSAYLEHNIGDNDINIDMEAVFIERYLQYKPGEKIINPMFANSAAGSPRPICLSIVDRNKICFSRNELVTGILVPRKILTAGSTEFLRFSSNVFYMKCIIRRNW